MPWTMGQNFNTRVFAQTTIAKLIEKFELHNDFELIWNSIHNAFEQANAKAVSAKYLNDFRFNQINCNQLLHCVYYLVEIPRLTGMAHDELYYSRPESLIALGNFPEDSDKMFVTGEFTGTLRNLDIAEEEVITDVANVQKKMLPFKQMFADIEMLEALPVELQTRKMVYKIRHIYELFKRVLSFI